MSVPKQRQTKSRGKRRRSHVALKKTQLTKCGHCNKPVLPHRACPNCGYYRGRQVLNIEAKELKRIEKEKAKREKEEQKEAKKEDKKAKKVQV
jgi:large subunit ribosomal protein L32